jgi:hypothetical protein
MKNSDSAFAIMILCYIATSVTQNHWMYLVTLFWLFVWGIVGLLRKNENSHN